MKRIETTSSSQWLGDEPQVSVGGLLEQESSFPEAAQFKDNSQDLRRGCGADKTWRGYHSVKIEDQNGLSLFCKGLGIYCNGFWGMWTFRST